MTVKRIVANIATDDGAGLAGFYSALFGLQTVMDHGWIMTLAGAGGAPVQISIMSEGGSGTPVPDISIEVEDVDATHARATDIGAEIAYPLTDEPWGVRRFYLRDPAGRLVNVLAHAAQGG